MHLLHAATAIARDQGRPRRELRREGPPPHPANYQTIASVAEVAPRRRQPRLPAATASRTATAQPGRLLREVRIERAKELLVPLRLPLRTGRPMCALPTSATFVGVPANARHARRGNSDAADDAVSACRRARLKRVEMLLQQRVQAPRSAWPPPGRPSPRLARSEVFTTGPGRQAWRSALRSSRQGQTGAAEAGRRRRLRAAHSDVAGRRRGSASRIAARAPR